MARKTHVIAWFSCAGLVVPYRLAGWTDKGRVSTTNSWARIPGPSNWDGYSPLADNTAEGTNDIRLQLANGRNALLLSANRAVSPYDRRRC